MRRPCLQRSQRTQRSEHRTCCRDRWPKANYPNSCDKTDTGSNRPTVTANTLSRILLSPVGVQFFDGPGRREAAFRHYPFGRRKQLIVPIPQDFTHCTSASLSSECRYCGKCADHSFAGTGRRHLARADNMAEWERALFWAICFREGSERVDRQSRLVGKIQINTVRDDARLSSSTPIFLGFPLHCRRFRIFDFDPMPLAPGAIGRESLDGFWRLSPVERTASAFKR